MASRGKWTSVYATSANNLQRTTYLGPVVSGSALRIRMTRVSIQLLFARTHGAGKVFAKAAPNSWQQRGPRIVRLSWQPSRLLFRLVSCDHTGMVSRIFGFWELQPAPLCKIALRLKITQTRGTSSLCMSRWALIGKLAAALS